MGFVLKLQSKEREIAELREQPIFELLDQRSDKIESINELKGKATINPTDLVRESLFNQLIIPCLRLSDGKITTALRIYAKMDIVRLWELLSVKLAYEYEDQTELLNQQYREAQKQYE